MSYFELILQRPIENLPTLAFILVGFYHVARMAMNLFSSGQKLQAGSQAIIAQDNGLQSKLIEFLATFQKEMIDRRASDEAFRTRLADILDEFVKRIDTTTLRIDGTTMATSAEIRAIAAKLNKFDKAMGNFYVQLKKKGVI